MRPNQWHGRAGGPADEQLALWDVGRVPYLLRDQAAVVGEGFHHGHEPPGRFDAARGQFVVGALAGEQRPAAADPRAVKRRAILMLAIAIVVVAMPGGARRRLDLEQCVDDFDRVAHARVVGRAQAEAHQGQRVRADQMTGVARVLGGRDVLDTTRPPGNAAASPAASERCGRNIRRRRICGAPVGAGDVHPAIDGSVPNIGGLAQVGGRWPLRDTDRPDPPPPGARRFPPPR